MSYFVFISTQARYQALVGGCEPLQSFLHKRLAENLNSEAALGTVNDVAQCVQWLRSTFLFVRAARDPKKYLGLAPSAPPHLITKKIEDLCIIAMNSLASSGLITMDEVSCIESTEAGRLLSIYYLDLETMKNIMKIKGNETLEQLLWIVCESHELSDMHLRVDERRCLNTLNRNNTAATIRFPMKGKISNRQMKLNCLIQAILGCLPIHDPSLNQEAIKVMRIADRICKCIAAYVTRPSMLKDCPQIYETVLNSITLAKCLEAHLWENSIYVSKQLRGIGPTFSALLATAGKVNFMLLEESHPRDLERIMNKGPPAGNLLRKQISLLPKYQLTITAIDGNSAKLDLILLNQMYLAENIERLTAGAHHKCYIIVGDSLNHLLLLTFFKDKDLINIPGGKMEFKIFRRHCFEHNIMAHCISTSFAGIDVNCEYQFESLEILDTGNKNNIAANLKEKNKHVKQTTITDTFTVRKRKNNENKINSPKEKRKRDLPIIERLKCLNQSLQGSHNETNQEINKEIVAFTNNQDQNEDIFSDSDLNGIDAFVQEIDENWYQPIPTAQNNRKTDMEADEYINKILSEIENDLYEPNKTNRPQLNKKIDNKETENNFFNKKVKSNKTLTSKKKKSVMSNFNVIDDIEKKASLFDDLESTIVNEENTFANTVKSSVDQYLEKTKRSAKLEDNITNIINTNNHTNSRQNENDNMNIVGNDKKELKNYDAEECEDINTDDYLNVKEVNDTEDNFNDEMKNDGNKLDLGVVSMEEKQNNEIQLIQNINNDDGSIKELNPSHLSLQSRNEELLMFPDCESLNVKLNNKLNPEIKVDFKFDLMKNCYSILNDNKYSMSIPLTGRSNFTKIQDINKEVLCYNNATVSSETDKIINDWALTPDCNTLTPKLLKNTSLETKFKQNVNQDVSNIISRDLTKKLSYSKTHINLYKNNNSDSKYCLIRKVKIDVDLIETLTDSKEKNAVAAIKDSPKENETENLKLVIDQYEPPGDHLPYLEFKTNLNKTSNVDLKEHNETRPEKINAYAYPIKPVSDEQIPTVKDIIHKYKDIFSRKPETVSQQNKEQSSAPNNDTYNIKSENKCKRKYSITSLPNPLKSSSQTNIKHNTYLKMDLNKRDNFENTDTGMNKLEQNEYFDAEQNKELKFKKQKSPTLQYGSPQCGLSEQSLNNDNEVNQIMFNPKTFLESFKENDIIPPPPQFRDTINLSHESDNTFSETDPNPPYYIFNEDNASDWYSTGADHQYKKTVLPSKEKQIWTLARDDVHAELPRSSMGIDNSKNRFLVTSRKSKLQNFKFSRKNILKVRK